MLGSALAVFGGNTSHSGVLLRPAIRQHWQAWLPIAIPEFAISAIGTDAVWLGAIE